MDLKNQNIFQKQVNFNENLSFTNTVANLKAMSVDPTKKNQVLSSLARFQGQMNQRDYDEILLNVKSMNGKEQLEQNRPLESQKQIDEKDYQKAVTDLKNLEREMRFK